MLLKRYGNIEYVLKLPLKRATKLIVKAQEEETKEYYYRWWLVRYPLYDKKTYESFEEFYDKVKPKKIKIDNRSEDEIMSEILEIEKYFRKGDVNNGTV